MIKKITTLAIGACLAFAHAYAADLFPDGNVREIQAGERLEPSDTVGGYPLIQNDGGWKFVGGKSYTSGGSADSIKKGFIQLDYVPYRLTDGKRMADTYSFKWTRTN